MPTHDQLKKAELTDEQMELQRRIQKAFVEAMLFRIPYPNDLPDPFDRWNEYDFYEI